jgi:hypothetical protein
MSVSSALSLPSLMNTLPCGTTGVDRVVTLIVSPLPKQYSQFGCRSIDPTGSNALLDAFGEAPVERNLMHATSRFTPTTTVGDIKLAADTTVTIGVIVDQWHSADQRQRDRKQRHAPQLPFAGALTTTP